MGQPSRRVYLDDFDSWRDVRQQFGVGVPEREPTAVFAVYNFDGYEGAALVMYRAGRRIGWAEGAHCSCDGLSDQWSPSMHTKVEIKKAVSQATYGLTRLYKKEILEWLTTV